MMEDISEELYLGIMNQDEKGLEKVFDKMIYKFMGDIAYEWINKNPEGWLKTFIGMFLRLNNIYYYPKVQNLKGRKDLVIPVNNKYYIIEAKVNESAKKAIQQIDELYVPQFTDGKDKVNSVGREYPLGEIIKVGINWDKKDNKFDIKIEVNNKKT